MSGTCNKQNAILNGIFNEMGFMHDLNVVFFTRNLFFKGEEIIVPQIKIDMPLLKINRKMKHTFSYEKRAIEEVVSF